MTSTQARASASRAPRRTPTWTSRWTARGPLWLQAGAVYLVLRLVSWVLLQLAAHSQAWAPGVTGPDAGHIDLALSWDAQWYERIATDGYPHDLPVGPDGQVQQNPWAFYPLYPLTVRLVMGLTGASFASVAPLLALLAGLAAAVVMAHLLRATLPTGATGATGAALGAVAVWAAFPSSPVLQMAYTESVAMLLLVACLLFLVRHQWWAVGLTALLLGLTRPIALPLAVVVVVSVVLRVRRRGSPAASRREASAMTFAVVATGLSGVLWTAIAWVGTGRRDAYTATMAAWRGDHTISFLQPWRNTISLAWRYLDPSFAIPGYDGRNTVVPAICIALALGLSLLLLVPRVAPGIDLRLRVWCAAYSVYLLAVVDGGTSIVRYLLPLFPLGLVLVGAHRERGGRWLSDRWKARTIFWVAAGIAGSIGWIWWLVLFSPPSDFPP